MTAQTNSRYERQITQDEQTLYDHLLYWAELETPDQLIERFRDLFIDGSHYDDSEVLGALDRVTASRYAQEDFRYVLNRCCHILINRWLARSQLQAAIPELIQLFDTVPSPVVAAGVYRSHGLRRLRELVRGFYDTEQYVTLQRLAQVLTQDLQGSFAENRPLGTLISRYPYLYSHCLLTENSVQEQKATVRKLQKQRQHQFELDLSQYATYLVRRSQLDSALCPTQETNSIIYPVNNPTLLGDKDLGTALKHYVGRVDGSHTYKDLAHNFLACSHYSQTFRSFKDDLYDYILTSVDGDYGKRQFNNQLYAQLKSSFPESNSRPVNDFLIVRTCSQLLNFLVVEGADHPRHFVFIDLITNLGPIVTTGLLLKIVLICSKVRPYLERRLSILFNHYEESEQKAVRWLVKILENLNIALSIHFGSMDLSFIR
ncbi:MAG: hypothetical protein IGR76_06940 [Synechococcales cyanobacterium T60_A2020_003]|nr:hypothetical protein [Synechococcales cyanobacterium T60_A2020_003]